MAQRLRMSAELGDWLAELCTSDPASAAEVGAAPDDGRPEGQDEGECADT